jgi:hypothetical protein
LKECAAAFEQAASSALDLTAKFQGAVAMLAGGKFTGDFYSPDNSSPFASLDDDPPDFSVGVELRNRGLNSQMWTPIEMFLWQRQETTDVVLTAAYAFGGAKRAERLLEHFTAAVRSTDASAPAG